MFYTLLLRPITSEITSNTRKIKNMIFAIPAALAAIPPKPNKAATSAIIKKMTVQRNIIVDFYSDELCCHYL